MNPCPRGYLPPWACVFCDEPDCDYQSLPPNDLLRATWPEGSTKEPK